MHLCQLREPCMHAPGLAVSPRFTRPSTPPHADSYNGCSNQAFVLSMNGTKEMLEVRACLRARERRGGWVCAWTGVSILGCCLCAA